VEADPWIHDIESNNKCFNEVGQKPKIQKVPSTLGEIKSNKKCYDLMVVAISPSHHGKREPEQMETLKIKFVR